MAKSHSKGGGRRGEKIRGELNRPGERRQRGQRLQEEKTEEGQNLLLEKKRQGVLRRPEKMKEEGMSSQRRTTIEGLSLPEGKKAEDLSLQGGKKEEGQNPLEGRRLDGQSLPGKKRRGDPKQPGGRMIEGQNLQGGKSQGALSLLGVKSQGIPDGMSKEEKIENLKRYLREGQNHLEQRLAGTPASQVEVNGEALQGREGVRGRLKARREGQTAWREEIRLPRGGGKMEAEEGMRIRTGKKEEGSLHHQLQMEPGERIKVEDQILPGGKRMRTGEEKLRSRKRS